MFKTAHPNSDRIFLASPWLLATASLLLAFIIGVFAVNNYQREKKLMYMALMQEGRAVLNIISSSSRGAMRNLIMAGDRERDHWQQSLQEVIDDGAEHQGILSLMLVNDDGFIIARNGDGVSGEQVPTSTRSFLSDFEIQGQLHRGRILQKSSQAPERFQVATRFNPMGGRKEMLNQMGERRQGTMMRRMRSQMQEHSPPHFLGKTIYIIAELDMTEFHSQVRKQFIYIVILSVVLLLVGVGGLLSLVAIQGLKGSQQKLKTITTFTDALISSMPLGIIALEQSGVIRTSNSSCLTILNLNGIISGKHYTDVFEERIQSAISHLLRETDSISEHELDLVVGEKEKNVTIICVVIDPELNDEASHMFLFQDLTKQKSLERELRRNERHTALGKMAAGVAHELRNPLSSIKGLTLLIQSKFDGQSQGKDEADILLSEVNRLDRSISELLDYTKPGDIDFKTVSLVQSIQKALTLIRSDAQAEDIEIVETYEDEAHQVRGDQDKLIQLFLNLFLNSLQAMKSGGTLTVETAQRNQKMWIIVKDTGMGISDEVKEKIFDPYFTTKNEGTGLGLSLCAKIVSDHKGTISIESTEGQGTAVTLVLPSPADHTSQT